MKRFACRYAIAQFLPYPETGEFVNIGVVLTCPEMRYLGTRLAATKRSKRATDFFTGLEARVYREAIRYVGADLGRLAKEVNEGRFPAQRVFEEIIRPRETLIRYGEPRAIMVGGHPSEALEPLFKRFIERDFATREYDEQRLTSLVGGVLKEAHLSNYFHVDQIGGSTFNVRFPFVHKENGDPSLVIKPLHLAHKDPSKVMDHGTIWVGRVERLKRHGTLPRKTLFAIDEAQGNKAATAAREIVGDLRRLGVETVSARDTQRIVAFAEEAKLL